MGAARDRPLVAERALSADDAGVSEFVGTILLVGLVVMMGSVVATLVFANLESTPPVATEWAAQPIAADDVIVTLVLRHGDAVPLDRLGFTIERGGVPVDVPRDAWGAPGAATLAEGDALTLPLATPAVAGELVRVRVRDTGANAVLATLDARVPGGAVDAQPAVTVVLASDKPSIYATGRDVALVTARASHPWGLGFVAGARLDASALSGLPAGTRLMAFADDGLSGDERAGDGNWTLSLTAASGAPRGAFALPVTLLLADGGTVAAGNLSLTVLPPAASAGTSLPVPSSASIAQLLLTNFTVDSGHVTRTDGDVLSGIVSAGGVFWAFHLDLVEQQGVAYATDLRVWTATTETAYRATGAGGRTPLVGLSLDLLDPTGAGAFAFSSGTADPGALYTAADVGENAVLELTRVGDASGQLIDSGLLSVEVTAS